MTPRFPFEWVVATRFMRDGLAQSALIMVGIGIGTAVIVFMSALLSGLQATIVGRALNSLPQITVIAPEKVARPQHSGEPNVSALIQPRAQQLQAIDQWQQAVGVVRGVSGVVAVTPVASGPAYAMRGDAVRAVSLIGIELSSYQKIIPLGDKLIEGSLSLATTDVVIGTELAKDLGVSAGDKISLSGASGVAATLSVTGVLDFGSKAINERNVYVDLRVAQNLLDLAGGVTSLDVNARDPFAAEAVAQVIQARTTLEADSWIKTNAQFFSAMSAQTLTNRMIRVFVGVAVALGITSVLIVSVVQKSSEIGILRAMGTGRGQILRLFLIQGGLMGLAGSVLGSLLGYSFLVIWRSLAKNADGTPMFLIEIDPSLFLITAVGATVVGVISASLPARSAAQLDPAAAIRG